MDVDPKYKVSPRDELKANARGMLMVARASPVLFGTTLAINSVQGLTPALLVAATGSFLSQVPAAIGAGEGSAPASAARASLLLIAGAIVISQLIGPVLDALNFGMQRRFKAHLSLRLMGAVEALPGMAYFEDPKFRDKLEIAEWIGWAPVQTVQSMIQVFRSVVSIAGFAAVIWRYAAWIAPALIAISVPAGFAAVWIEGMVGLARWRHSPEMRRSDYFRKLALTPEPGKELRIFRLRDFVLGRQTSHYFASMKEAWSKRRRGMIIRLGLQLPPLGVVSLAYFTMLNDAASRRIDAGAFSAVAMATVGMSSMVVAAFTSLSWARRSNYYLPVAFQILDLAESEPRLDVSGTRPALGLAPSGLRFEGVSFSYPGTERRIMEGLDLAIPAGERLALVGENGAGKTTLIKLLCRLYDPDEGRITLDGIDIREFDLAELRRRMAVIFQDFVRYKLSPRDNVGFGAVGKAVDQQLIEDAAAKVGVLEKIESLTKGWETPLAKEFEDGVDLSGGEWQRIALARAMMAATGRDADLLILDEPTASLDVRLEHEIYEHFAELVQGRTTILVSHRFSTVRMAERIVFLESGRVVEEGSHEELMAARGPYSELYEIQASHFRLTGTLE